MSSSEAIKLPDHLRDAAEARAVEAGFKSVHDYVCALVQADLGEELDAETEAKLLEGLATPAREWTRADIDARIRQFEERLARESGRS